MKKKLLVLVLAGLLPLGPLSTYSSPAYADDPPVDSGMDAEPADPDALPDPPDGVASPDSDLPADGDLGTDQGEDGAPPPAPDGDGTEAPEPGNNDAPD